MAAPVELHTELNRLLAVRDTYRYAGEDIRDKVLVGLIAPSAVGKSTIVAEILRQCREAGIDAGEVGSIMTRQRRQDGSDPDNYRTASEGITHAGLIAQIKQNSLVNWSLSATGDLYATDAASYPAEYNFLPLLPDSLPMLKKAGFRKLIAIYITAPPEEWANRLAERRSNPTFAGRLTEAASSLQFAKENKSALHIISNRSAIVSGKARPAEAAKKILDITLGSTPVRNDPEAMQYIDDMLAYVHNLQEVLDGAA